MTTALAPGVSPEALAPGDPDGARALAARLEGYAEGAGAAAARLRALEAGTWVGEAAEAFRASLDTLPQRLSRASTSFSEAASALRAYALVAEEARQRAALALARFDDAQAATARWEFQRADHDAALAAEAGGGPPAGPGPSGHDPGAGARRAAEGLAEELGADLEAAERAVEQRLRRAAGDAPDEPGFWDQAFRFGKEFVGGAVEATVDLGEFVFKLTPTYALVDPEGYVDNLVGLGQGVAYGVTHPVEFAQAVTNWDMWLDNPARALGQLVPDLVLAVGTAGAGTAATAASRAARGADKLDDVADGARAADRVARGPDGRGIPDADTRPSASLWTRPAEDVLGLPPEDSWGNPASLARHFRDHGTDFGATNPADYANQASEFFQRAQQQGLPTRVDADGVIRAFDPSTNTFGAYSADGTSRTFFRPTSSTYWDRQPGSPPWTG